MLIPIDERLVEHPEKALRLLDGIIVAGGGDVDPVSYGSTRHPKTYDTDELRDRVELAISQCGVAYNMPLLGICRGMQIIALATGGVLHQHLPDVVGHDRHRKLPAGFAEHDVWIAPGSLTERAVGSRRITGCKSHHHQGPECLGDGVVPVGWDDEGAIEAIEIPECRFALGVLWHPEEDESLGDRGLIKSLVDQARADATHPLVGN